MAVARPHFSVGFPRAAIPVPVFDTSPFVAQPRGLEDIDLQTLVLAYWNLVEYQAFQDTVGSRVRDCASARVDATALFVEDSGLATFDHWLAVGDIDTRVDG